MTLSGFEGIKGEVVQGVKEAVKSAKIVKVFIKTRKDTME